MFSHFFIYKIVFLDDIDSLVHKQRSLFGDEKLSYLYTTQPFLMPELNLNSISLFLTKDRKVSFVDGEGKTFSSSQNLDGCANEILKNQYEFSGNNLYKYRSNSMIEVTESNKEAMDYFKRDLCMLNQFSKMIRNDGKPNFFAFYIQSLNKLSKNSTTNEIALIQEIWSLAKSKVFFGKCKFYPK